MDEHTKSDIVSFRGAGKELAIWKAFLQGPQPVNIDPQQEIEALQAETSD